MSYPHGSRVAAVFALSSVGLLLLVVALIVAGKASSSTTGAPGSAPATAAADDGALRVTDAEMWAAYETNRAQAELIFRGRKVRISGIVAEVKHDAASRTVLEFGPGSAAGSAIWAVIDQADAARADELRRATQVQLRCVGAGVAVTHPLLHDCRIE